MAKISESKEDYVRDYVERCKPDIAQIFNLKDGDPAIEKFLKIASGVGSDLYDYYQDLMPVEINITDVNHEDRSISIEIKSSTSPNP